MLNLSSRLQAIAGLVPKGTRVADVGTDHGYIPIYLLQSGICESAVASDVREGPLQSAVRSASALGLEDKISFRLADGLRKVQPEEADTVIIAGMGGETIAAILEACPWAKSSGLHYLLQPMTRSEDLRRYLLTHGFTILSETTVEQGGHLYVIVEAEWTDAPFCEDESAFVLGKLDGTRDRAWLLWQKELLTKRKNGMTAAGETEEVARLAFILQQLEERL